MSQGKQLLVNYDIVCIGSPLKSGLCDAQLYFSTKDWTVLVE